MQITVKISQEKRKNKYKEVGVSEFQSNEPFKDSCEKFARDFFNQVAAKHGFFVNPLQFNFTSADQILTIDY